MPTQLNPGVNDMECTEVRRRLVDYMEGDLDTAATDLLLRHIDSCSPCEAVLEGLRNVTALLGLLTDFEMPPALSGPSLDGQSGDSN